jgi:hypothetical protein
LPRPASPLPEIFLSTPQLASRVSRDLKEGRVRKLAPALYTTNVTESPEALVRRHLWRVASLVFPDAVITDRTAFEAGASSDGSVFLAATAARDVALPGVTLRARRGCGSSVRGRQRARRADHDERRARRCGRAKADRPHRLPLPAA